MAITTSSSHGREGVCIYPFCGLGETLGICLHCRLIHTVDTLFRLTQMRSSFTHSHTHVMMNSFFLQLFICVKVQLWAKMRQDSLSVNYWETFSLSGRNVWKSIDRLEWFKKILFFSLSLSPDFYSNIRSFLAESDYSLHSNLTSIPLCKMDSNLGERFLWVIGRAKLMLSLI